MRWSTPAARPSLRDREPAWCFWVRGRAALRMIAGALARCAPQSSRSCASAAVAELQRRAPDARRRARGRDAVRGHHGAAWARSGRRRPRAAHGHDAAGVARRGRAWRSLEGEGIVLRGHFDETLAEPIAEGVLRSEACRAVVRATPADAHPSSTRSTGCVKRDRAGQSAQDLRALPAALAARCTWHAKRGPGGHARGDRAASGLRTRRRELGERRPAGADRRLPALASSMRCVCRARLPGGGLSLRAPARR